MLNQIRIKYKHHQETSRCQLDAEHVCCATAELVALHLRLSWQNIPEFPCCERSARLCSCSFLKAAEALIWSPGGGGQFSWCGHSRQKSHSQRGRWGSLERLPSSQSQNKTLKKLTGLKKPNLLKVSIMPLSFILWMKTNREIKPEQALYERRCIGRHSFDTEMENKRVPGSVESSRLHIHRVSRQFMPNSLTSEASLTSPVTELKSPLIRVRIEMFPDDVPRHRFLQHRFLRGAWSHTAQTPYRLHGRGEHAVT